VEAEAELVMPVQIGKLEEQVVVAE